MRDSDRNPAPALEQMGDDIQQAEAKLRADFAQRGRPDSLGPVRTPEDHLLFSTRNRTA